MSQLNLPAKVKKRSYLRADITRTQNKLRDNPEFYTVEECNIALTRLSTLQANLSNLNEEIINTMLTVKPEEQVEADIQDEYDSQANYDSTLIACMSKLHGLQANLSPVLSANNLASNMGQQQPPLSESNDRLRHNRLKLPQIPLPTYGHRPEENLFKFLEDFSDIIDKYQGVSEYEKFTLLKGQLTGEALHVLGGLPKASQNFQSAKNRLIEAFGSLITQQFDCIKNLRNLKFSAKTPYEFLGSMCQISESFAELSITPDILQQYFFWNAMPELLQNQFIAITNSNKPNLDEINKSMFKAMERYVELAKRAASKQTDASHISSYAVECEQSDAEIDAGAVNMDQIRAKSSNNRQYCSLCSTQKEMVTTHPTYACTIYPTAEAKLNRINSTNACRKCANAHNTKDCRYNFTKMCSNCNGAHFSYICGKSIKSNSNTK